MYSSDESWQDGIMGDGRQRNHLMTLGEQKSEDKRANSKYSTGKKSLAEGHVVIILFRSSRTLRISKGESLISGLELLQTGSQKKPGS